MANNAKKHIFFVEDEPKVRKPVGRILEQVGFKVSYFSRTSDCLEQLRSRLCDLLIIDVKTTGVNGIEPLQKAKLIIPSLPVLVIIRSGDLPMAVTALKTGASDIIEKPLNRKSLLSTVELTLKRESRTHSLENALLTKTEMGILRLILDGKSNKEIAHLLHRSVRTIEVHRSHIMRKLGVNNVVHLVEKSIAMRLIELPISRY